MKNQILDVLREHPTGLRLREIAMYLRGSRFALVTPLDELHKAGLVYGRQNYDHANGEYYIIWYAAK
jgi:DNA-binding IclR family transcriptional regulator